MLSLLSTLEEGSEDDEDDDAISKAPFCSRGWKWEGMRMLRFQNSFHVGGNGKGLHSLLFKVFLKSSRDFQSVEALMLREMAGLKLDAVKAFFLVVAALLSDSHEDGVGACPETGMIVYKALLLKLSHAETHGKRLEADKPFQSAPKVHLKLMEILFLDFFSFNLRNASFSEIYDLKGKRASLFSFDNVSLTQEQLDLLTQNVWEEEGITLCVHPKSLHFFLLKCNLSFLMVNPARHSDMKEIGGDEIDVPKLLFVPCDLFQDTLCSWCSCFCSLFFKLDGEHGDGKDPADNDSGFDGPMVLSGGDKDGVLDTPLFTQKISDLLISMDRAHVTDLERGSCPSPCIIQCAWLLHAQSPSNVPLLMGCRVYLSKRTKGLFKVGFLGAELFLETVGYLENGPPVIMFFLGQNVYGKMVIAPRSKWLTKVSCEDILDEDHPTFWTEDLEAKFWDAVSILLKGHGMLAHRHNPEDLACMVNGPSVQYEKIDFGAQGQFHVLYGFGGLPPNVFEIVLKRDVCPILIFVHLFPDKDFYLECPVDNSSTCLRRRYNSTEKFKEKWALHICRNGPFLDMDMNDLGPCLADESHFSHVSHESHQQQSISFVSCLADGKLNVGVLMPQAKTSSTFLQSTKDASLFSVMADKGSLRQCTHVTHSPKTCSLVDGFKFETKGREKLSCMQTKAFSRIKGRALYLPLNSPSRNYIPLMDVTLFIYAMFV